MKVCASLVVKEDALVNVKVLATKDAILGVGILVLVPAPEAVQDKRMRNYYPSYFSNL